MTKLFLSFLALLLAASLLGGCVKAREGTPLSKNPPSVPTTTSGNDGDIQPTVVRNRVANLQYSVSFLSGASILDFSKDDTCAQWVSLHDGNQFQNKIGDYVELSNQGCPANGVVAEDKVLQRLKIEQDPTYFTNFYIYDEQTGYKIGHVRRYSFTPFNGPEQITYRLLSLCDVTGEFGDLCGVVIEDKGFGEPHPVYMYVN